MHNNLVFIKSEVKFHKTCLKVNTIQELHGNIKK